MEFAKKKTTDKVLTFRFLFNTLKSTLKEKLPFHLKMITQLEQVCEYDYSLTGLVKKKM